MSSRVPLLFFFVTEAGLITHVIISLFHSQATGLPSIMLTSLHTECLNFVNGTGWDTHNEGQLKQHLLIEELDRAMSTLITDLEAHKLLDKTLIVVNTEFGRPSAFDGRGGRNHQGSAFTLVLAGGGLNHCGAYGVTDELSKEIVENPVGVPDLFATVHSALGINPAKELYDGDRPIPITDRGQPTRGLF